MSGERSGLTPLGRAFVVLLVLGLLGAGGWLLIGRSSPPAGKTAGPATAPPDPAGAAAARPIAPAAAAEVVEPYSAVPRLAPPAAYEPKDGVVDIELSEYAGYAGLIAANGGLEPSPESFFARRHGFRLRIRLSEEESWSALNAGQMAASATTVDVLAVYGRQFQVVVPSQIGFSRGADGIVVRSEVKRINALKGKVVAAAQFTEADFFLRYLAQEAALPVGVMASLDAVPDPARINLVYCSDAFAAGDLLLADLAAGSGRLAGAVTWAPKTTEVASGSGGLAHVLVTNRNLLIVADILVVNRGFAERHGAMVKGLVEGLLEGNRLVRTDPEAHLPVIARAFGWQVDEARAELAKVHLSNGPESLAFFSGAIDAAGSFGSIYQSAVLAYGPGLIPDPVDAGRFLDLASLQAIEAAGGFAGETIAIAPLRSTGTSPLERDPLLSKDIRFHFNPNSADLDLTRAENLENLATIPRLLQVSPGSTLLLRGHVDNAMVETFRKQGGESFVRQMALAAMELSKRRAAAIERLLVERQKVDRARLETVGRGWEEPASADPAENRRVEVQWFTVE